MPGSRLSLEQSSLAMLAGVKLRLGALNSVGEQKGVDSMVVSDLIELSRNSAIADAVLLSGDEDLRIAVQLAQAYGARVHLLAVGDVSRNVSQSLQMEADSVRSLPAEWLQSHFIRLEPPIDDGLVFALPTHSDGESAAGEPPTLDDAAEGVAAELLDAAPEHVALLRIHFQSIQSVPPEFDRKLIAKTAKLLNLDRPFSTDEMRRIRGIFQRVVRTRPDSLTATTISTPTSTTTSATPSAMSAAMSAAISATSLTPPSPEAVTEPAEPVVHPTPPQAVESGPPIASN
jgi:hypothetical protein